LLPPATPTSMRAAKWEVAVTDFREFDETVERPEKR
jgi:hypothetical protein